MNERQQSDDDDVRVEASALRVEFREEVAAKLVQHVGSDQSVIAAARVSVVGPESESYLAAPAEESAGLIRYLMQNRHGTPFEHASMTFLVEAPIFVFREFHRHRVGWSYNETSGRYSELKPVFYIPPAGRGLHQRGKAGEYSYVQGDPAEEEYLAEVLKRRSLDSYAAYRDLIDRRYAREVARMVLPVNLFSTMYATCNPRSLMHFLSLRTSTPEATFPSFPMREIEMVAEEMEAEFRRLFPLTHGAYCAAGRIAP